MVFSCAVYNGTINNGTLTWLDINLIVILASFLVIGAIYMISRVLPDSTKAKLTGIMKIEITQVFISVIVILILLAFSNLGCSLVQSLTTGAGSSNPQAAVIPTNPGPIPCPTNTIQIAPTSDPFQYAEQYTGTLAFTRGPDLAIQVYADQITFSVISGIWTAIGQILSDFIPEAQAASESGFISVTIPVGLDLGIAYGLLSDLYVDLFIPLIMVGVVSQFVQYIGLIAMNALAFSILLPIALVMRSFAFTGSGLRIAGNSLLAIAIAGYLIYPLTVAFDNYAISWIFTECNGVTSNCNPSAVYLCSTYGHENINAQTQASAGGYGPIGNILFGVAAIPVGVSSFFSSIVGLSGNGMITQIQLVVNSIAEFLFTSLVMFAINISITIGFAMGLAKALNNGIEGASSFWGAI